MRNTNVKIHELNKLLKAMIKKNKSRRKNIWFVKNVLASHQV